MICAYLLFTKVFKTAAEVLEYYGSQRTFDSNRVTIPSQQRYVDYFSTRISQELQYSPVKLMVTSIVLKTPPHVGFNNHKAHNQFQIFEHFLAPFQFDVYSINWEDSMITIKFKFRIIFHYNFTTKKRESLKLFRSIIFSFNIETVIVGRQKTTFIAALN